jgi:hypothetical protein
MLIRPKKWVNKHATLLIKLIPGGMLTLSLGQRKHVIYKTHTFAARLRLKAGTRHIILYDKIKPPGHGNLRPGGIVFFAVG